MSCVSTKSSSNRYKEAVEVRWDGRWIARISQLISYTNRLGLIDLIGYLT